MVDSQIFNQGFKEGRGWCWGKVRIREGKRGLLGREGKNRGEGEDWGGRSS